MRCRTISLFPHYHTNSLFNAAWHQIYAIFFYLHFSAATTGKVARQKVSRHFARSNIYNLKRQFKMLANFSSHFINTQILLKEWICFFSYYHFVLGNCKSLFYSVDFFIFILDLLTHSILVSGDDSSVAVKTEVKIPSDCVAISCEHISTLSKMSFNEIYVKFCKMLLPFILLFGDFRHSFFFSSFSICICPLYIPEMKKKPSSAFQDNVRANCVPIETIQHIISHLMLLMLLLFGWLTK